ncbi:glycosyltransferase 25 family member [Lucilia cuprina]|uniref:glycosyltransferase 25 family member n=1 Tax=Lucilia cuprina TaxID=7375 RepID=UPI001F056997|nr:glycosyltransferase 25 family member [Lucilia cuprina]
MKILGLLIISLSLLAARAEEGNAAGTTLEELQKLLPVDLSDEVPTVVVALMVRNKAHVLPLFLSYLERQDYPKERMSLWIHSDYNTDNSIEILTEWLQHVEPLYHKVHKVLDSETQRHQNESSPFDWPRARFEHLISLKEQAKREAKQNWADYIFYLDADVLLTEPHTLTHLVELRLPIVAPMLLSEGLYSNFWCGMSPDYYYLRTDLYQDIYNVNREGIFQVPMIHSAVLISLNYKGSHYLTFDRDQFLDQQKNDLEYMQTLGPQCRLYDGPVDDIIVFAISANCSKIPLFITNEIPFGYILQPLDASDNIAQDYKQLVNIKTNIIHDLGDIIEVNEYLKKFEREEKKHKLSLDHIYMINLERRPERREKMEKLFNVLGLDVEYFPAVDGQKLNHHILKEMGIKFLPGYEDPYHHRPMTMGEIGCFLSHYKIWEKMVEEKQEQVLILEDDIRFEPYFKDKAESVMEQIRNVIEYDLVYFGRKRLKEESEPWVANTENLVHAGYSYWTLGYVISLKGAEKLLAAKPLENLIPVDEFLPVMFNRHPNKTWANAFPKRDLMAFSANPLLLFPTHYTGDYGYISDTEDSVVIKGDGIITNTAASGAQLKSDPEKAYLREPRLESKPLELKEAQFEAAANVKTHEEL